jgi:hypothetical protein
MFELGSLACTRVRAPQTHSQAQQIDATPTQSLKEPEITVSQFLNNVFDPLESWERSAASRMWERIPDHENYQVSRYDYGEIAGAYGLALVTVDMTPNLSDRLGLLVFIRRTGHKYDLYWIYKNDNVSELTLNRASGDIFVTGTREDGSSINCEIAWSRKENKWTCINF